MWPGHTKKNPGKRDQTADPRSHYHDELKTQNDYSAETETLPPAASTSTVLVGVDHSLQPSDKSWICKVVLGSSILGCSILQ